MSYLTTTESTDLTTYEQTIESGMQSFLQVGEALWKIREGKLYRASHKTFEDYCREKWSMSKTHCNRLITGSLVANEVAPMGVEITSERQARELSRIEPSRRVEVLEKASESGSVTARSIREAAKPESLAYFAPEEQEEENEPTPAPRLPRATVDSAKGIWLLAKAQLDKISPQDLSRSEVFLAVVRYALEQTPRKRRKQPKRGDVVLSNGNQYARIAISQLEKILATDTEREDALKSVITWATEQLLADRKSKGGLS